jgi:hypothetical protein
METTSRQESIRVPVTPETSVSGVLGIPEWWPTGERTGLVLAHDSSASMDHPLLLHLHRTLSDMGTLTLRFNFPFAEMGKKRADAQPLLQRTYRAVVGFLLSDPQNAPAKTVLSGLGLGARVAAEVVAQGLKADALILYSYPLHPVGKPGQVRADELFRIICPILFIQGTKDPTCRLDRLRALLRRIGAPTALSVIEDADHGFGVARRSPRTLEQVQQEVVGITNAFLRRSTRFS